MDNKNQEQINQNLSASNEFSKSIIDICDAIYAAATKHEVTTAEIIAYCARLLTIVKVCKENNENGNFISFGMTLNEPSEFFTKHLKDLNEEINNFRLYLSDANFKA